MQSEEKPFSTIFAEFFEFSFASELCQEITKILCLNEILSSLKNSGRIKPVR